MKEKQLKEERSQKDYGFKKQRVEIKVEQGEEGLFTVKSTVPLLSLIKAILQKPKYLLALLLIAISGIALPLLIKILTAGLNFSPVIFLIGIFLILIVINFAYFAFFRDWQAQEKSLLTWNIVPLISCNLALVGTLIFVYLSSLIQLTTSSLGIPQWLSAIIILLCPINFIFESRFTREIYGLQRFNLPLYVVFSQQDRCIYQSWLWWWLKNRRQIKRYIPEHNPKYISKYDPKHVGVNLLGGLIPIAVAVWQFTRVAISPILLVTGVTTILCYSSVKIVPERGICLKNSRIWTIVMAVSILAFWISDSSSTIAIAYSGITLGSLIGADLLHLKDFKLEQTVFNSLSIGGAGFKDGIVVFGLYTLLTIEFWQQISSLIFSR